MVTDMFELKFKKDEKFLNNNIYIAKNGQLYMTNEFASYLYGSNLTNKKRNWYHLNDHHITYGDYINYKCNLYVKKTNNLQTKGLEKFNFYLCGNSGSHGFGGMQFTKKKTLGVKTVRKSNKYIIEEYLKSPFFRLDKIKKIIEKIKNVN